MITNWKILATIMFSNKRFLVFFFLFFIVISLGYALFVSMNREMQLFVSDTAASVMGIIFSFCDGSFCYNGFLFD